MTPALILARTASAPQDGQSRNIEQQLQITRDYAASHAFSVVKEIVIAGIARDKRSPLEQLKSYVRSHPEVHIIVVTATDRISRSLSNLVALDNLIDELDLEIHIVNEQQILRKCKGATQQGRLTQSINA